MMDYLKFETMTKLTEKQLKMFMSKTLRDAYGDNNIREDEKYLCAFGSAGVCLVAHLDMVYDEEDREDILIVRDPTKRIMWSPDGLAADDRAGVLMINEIVNKYKLDKDLLPNIILTTGEESDLSGALEITRRRYYPIWTTTNYFIELDRQGRKDSVFYGCNNLRFEEYVNSFGFKTAKGTYTDINIICPQCGIAGVNLSVGYFNEHSFAEMLVESYWDATFEKVISMLEDAHFQHRWEYIPSEIPDPYYEHFMKGDNE